jgi:RNA polymerase sigma-70 factor (ECF subfamily)
VETGVPERNQDNKAAGPRRREVTSLSLLEGIKANDQPSWQRLLTLYSPLVYHWCARWQVTGADADDVVQDVFTGVAASIETFQAVHPTLSPEGPERRRSFRAWLGGITRNKLYDFCERRQRQPAARGGSDAYAALQAIPEVTLADDDADRAQITGVYYRALDLIRADFEERTWQAFWRTAVQNQTPAEVGPALGMSTVAVRQAKARVLRRLKEEVGDLIE